MQTRTGKKKPGCRRWRGQETAFTGTGVPRPCCVFTNCLQMRLSLGGDSLTLQQLLFLLHKHMMRIRMLPPPPILSIPQACDNGTADSLSQFSHTFAQNKKNSWSLSPCGGGLRFQGWVGWEGGVAFFEQCPEKGKGTWKQAAVDSGAVHSGSIDGIPPYLQPLPPASNH